MGGGEGCGTIARIPSCISIPRILSLYSTALTRATGTLALPAHSQGLRLVGGHFLVHTRLTIHANVAIPTTSSTKYFVQPSSPPPSSPPPHHPPNSTSVWPCHARHVPYMRRGKRCCRTPARGSWREVYVKRPERRYRNKSANRRRADTTPWPDAQEPCRRAPACT